MSVSPRLYRCPFLRLEGGSGGGGGGGMRLDSSVVGERAGGAGGGARRLTPVNTGDKTVISNMIVNMKNTSNSDMQSFNLS